MNLQEKLFEILKEIEKHKPKEFSGLGLVVYNELDELPISSLKKIDSIISLPISNYISIRTFLIDTSISRSKFHDGFHLLNSEFQLTHICQYVAPPILNNLDAENEYGSRYRTAIYTSLVNGIVASGVLSLNYPPTVFVKGTRLF